MKNIKNEEGRQGSESLLVLVKRLLVLAAAGLRLGRKIYARQGEIVDSLEIMAAQKARELSPEESAEVEAK